MFAGLRQPHAVLEYLGVIAQNASAALCLNGRKAATCVPIVAALHARKSREDAQRGYRATR
jgi:hypothetical protein